MKLRILAVGRARSGPESALIAEYQKRLHWPLAIEEVEEKRPLSGAELKAREGALLQAAIDRAAKAGGKPILVALDERGKMLGSRDFAARLKAWEEQGAPEILFLLGGADGLAPEIRDQATFVLSLGQMTWPHLLARAMLVEQIYRAQQILAGHPYHRD
ncbi:MAG TPA: 23S rRNA (pseudouridine(1915)-N(3))-methyltransferase RlmH [Dongiaceae bacterium]|jgi:23S rRNA (pseudouridine1915-N3)-methyltransferase|nr:23S rRNA (pseudouridine(1915)-N(3))-methyltransferase RlmH [Dongiaceae bacterium]